MDSGSSTVSLRLRIDDEDDLVAARQSAEEAGDVEIEETSGTPSGDFEPAIVPIVAILIGAGVLAGANFIADWWEKRGGGLVLDQRKDAKDDIYRDRDVPYGFIIIYPADGGAVKVETKDMPKNSTAQLLETLITSAFTSVTDVAKAAKEALQTAGKGDNKVEVQPAAA